MKLIMEHWRDYLSEKRKLFKKAKQIPYDFDWGLLSEQERPPTVATFDFDDTLQFTDTKTATPIVQAVKDLAAQGSTVYIVTSRQNTDDNQQEIEDFIRENDLPTSGVYFTNFADKIDTQMDLESEMHFDNDPQEIEVIINSDAEIRPMQVDASTGTLINV